MNTQSDPRLLVIPQRLARVKHIVPVMSSKGGVGKTLLSTLLALAGADKKLKVGLLDLDFTNPSTHIVLGIDPASIQPVEEKGVIPPIIHGIKYMTLAIYTGENPTPLRGSAINDAFLEILAITRWGELDYLFIDTPPGLSDPQLNLLTYLPSRIEPLVVATPSPLAIRSVEKLLKVLIEGNYKITGLVENMSNNSKLLKIAEKYNVKYLGSIPYYNNIDGLIGNLEALRSSQFYGKIIHILKGIIRA